MKLRDYDIGDAMKRARIKAGYSTKDMAAMLNMTIIQYVDYEDGHRIPSWKSINQFAQKLNISIGSLFNGSTEPIEELKNNSPGQLTQMENSLLTKFNYLTPIGKEEAIRRVAELTYVPMYGDPDYTKDNTEIRVAVVETAEKEPL